MGLEQESSLWHLALAVPSAASKCTWDYSIAVDRVLLPTLKTLKTQDSVTSALTRCSGLTLAGCRVPPKAALSHTSSAGSGRKYNEGLVGQDKGREISLTAYCQGQNRLSLEKLTIKSE